MLRLWLFRVLTFTTLTVLYGCGTVRNCEGSLPPPGRCEGDLGGLIGPPGGRQIYGGVTWDLFVGFGSLTNPEVSPWNLIGAYLVLVDLPLSFVTDTLTLPWTISATMSRVSSKDGPEPGQAAPASPAADPAKTP
jgi:uncharacterized protein YceK